MYKQCTATKLPARLRVAALPNPIMFTSLLSIGTGLTFLSQGFKLSPDTENCRYIRAQHDIFTLCMEGSQSSPLLTCGPMMDVV